VIDEILLHVEKEYPKEACGLIVFDGKEEIWIPCKNVSEFPEEEFLFDQREFINAQIHYDILKIVHSHSDSSADPSPHDKSACKAIKIPYLIIGWPEGDIREILPNE